MATIRSPLDKGVVLYLTPTAGAGSYTDASGNTQQSEAFAGAGTYSSSSTVRVGAVGKIRIDVAIRRQGGGVMGDVTVRVRTRRTDPSGLFGWAPCISTTINAAGTTSTTYAHALTAAGGSDYAIISDDATLSDELQVQVTTGGGTAGDDRVIVALTCGGRP